jgi:hypothetical protein
MAEATWEAIGECSTVAVHGLDIIRLLEDLLLAVAIRTTQELMSFFYSIFHGYLLAFRWRRSGLRFSNVQTNFSVVSCVGKMLCSMPTRCVQVDLPATLTWQQ